MADRKYELDTEENRAFVKRMRENLLRFGRRFPSAGGSSYYLGDDGTPWTDRPRETWITGRMAHVYSIGAMLGVNGCGALADAALNGLRGELHDRAHGGWYAGLTADGGILPDKQCYAHAFVILAASSALLAGRDGARELLDEAIYLYDERFWDETRGLAYDTWNTEFTVLDSYRGLNANMHSAEAFLAAADALGDAAYRARAGRIISHALQWARENNWRLPEHFSENWEADLSCNKERPDDPFKPYGATPGHGIEWARLTIQWAFSFYGKDPGRREEYVDAAQKLYGRAVSDAWNCDGAPGLVYTTDWDGKAIVHDRMHWTLAEAINTAGALFRVTGEQRYREDYAAFMEYLDTAVLDHRRGSWFHQLNERNEAARTVWPGKPDIYHALQATLIPYNQEVGVSVAAGICGSPQ